MNETIRRIVSFIFPERCPLCGAVIEHGETACKACTDSIIQSRVPEVRGVQGCRCVSSFEYSGLVCRMLIRIKYYDRVQFIRQAAAVLAEDIARYYDGFDFDMITYVPMTARDERARGYNQSELLAKELSALFDIPCVGTLIKTKRTKKQHNLKVKERKKNLKGAFKLTDKDAVKGKRILIIDDIVTSGYTLGECCRTIMKSKPELLCCASVARSRGYGHDRSDDR